MWYGDVLPDGTQIYSKAKPHTKLPLPFVAPTRKELFKKLMQESVRRDKIAHLQAKEMKNGDATHS